MTLDKKKVKKVLKSLIAEIDYDIYKDILKPEDPEDAMSFGDYADLFIELYEELDD